MSLLNSKLSSNFFFPSHSKHHPKSFLRYWTYIISPVSASLTLSSTCLSFLLLSQFQARSPHCSPLKDAPDSKILYCFSLYLLFLQPSFTLRSHQMKSSSPCHLKQLTHPHPVTLYYFPGICFFIACMTLDFVYCCPLSN